MLLGAMLAGCATPHRRDSPNWTRCKATCARDGIEAEAVIETDDRVVCACVKPEQRT